MWITWKLQFVLGISQLKKLTSCVSGIHVVAQDVTCFLICTPYPGNSTASLFVLTS